MARRNVSSMVSGMGMALSFIEKVMQEVRKQGLKDEAFHRFVTDEEDLAVKQLVYFMKNKHRYGLPLMLEDKLFAVEIDSSLSCEQMIKRARLKPEVKKYFSNDLIMIADQQIPSKRRFFRKPPTKVRRILEFRRFLEEDDLEAIKKRVKKEGYRFAHLPEVLAFICQYRGLTPQDSRPLQILVLGTAAEVSFVIGEDGELVRKFVMTYPMLHWSEREIEAREQHDPYYFEDCLIPLVRK
jgi:hypothetical protein